jgi:hypothetical protein
MPRGWGQSPGRKGGLLPALVRVPVGKRVDTPLASVRTFEIRVRVVEKDDTDIPSVVRVDHTGANVDKKLPGETRSRR